MVMIRKKAPMQDKTLGITLIETNEVRNVFEVERARVDCGVEQTL